MRRSEKILLAILVLGLLAWQGSRFVDRLLFAPIRQSQERLAGLDDRITEQRTRAAESARVERSLRQWRQRSLPPDPLTAQRLYQQWLTDLAQDCGFGALQVFPDQVSRRSDACVGVLVSVTAEARLSQLCLFLSRFYRAAVAQQITRLSIDSTQDRGDPTLRITILAEGLSLRDAAPRQRLFPTSTLARDLGQQQTTVEVADEAAFPKDVNGLLRIGGEYMPVETINGSECSVKRGTEQSPMKKHARGALVEFVPLVESPARADYTQLLAQNLFAKPAPPVVRAPATKKEAPPLDPADFTYLVAALVQDDERQAWLYDRLNNHNIVVGQGNPFSIGGVEGIVQTIGNGFIELAHNEARWRLRLGKNLRSMERLSDAADGTGDAITR